ncbi:MAG: RAMP superfamily CRISPR-associated protein [Candidatus Methanofastidiosia archaeon]
MKYDFYSCYWDEENQEPLFDEINQIENEYHRTELYALSLGRDSSKIRALEIYKSLFSDYEVPEETLNLMGSLSLREPHYNAGVLPKSSFLLHVKFILRKPYISKDDEEFYIHENPVAKEKVFKVPYIRASSWKGNLRWSALKNLIDEISEIKEEQKKWEIALEGRARIVRIFGNEKENREDSIFERIFPGKIRDNNKEVNKFNQEFQDYITKRHYVNKDGNGKGRLACYPTFFDKVSLDIINPHERETRKGTNPITLEVVPENTEGNLHLVYLPLDRLGEEGIHGEVRADLLLLCKAVNMLLTEYGMSAKRTSGYGASDIGEVKFKSRLLKEYTKYADLDELIKKLEKDRKIAKNYHGRSEIE